MAGEGRRTARLDLGAAAVLSLAHAAEALPMRERDAREWLRAQGLVRRLDGREVVIWGDVLDRIRGPVAETAPAPRPTPMRRTPL